jgi:hypothetical protein
MIIHLQTLKIRLSFYSPICGLQTVDCCNLQLHLCTFCQTSIFLLIFYFHSKYTRVTILFAKQKQNLNCSTFVFTYFLFLSVLTQYNKTDLDRTVTDVYKLAN